MAEPSPAVGDRFGDGGGAGLGRPGLHLALTALRDRQDRRDPPRGFVDDASGLNATRVADVVDVPAARTRAGDVSMEGMTRELIDTATGLGGRSYLPYRLHASVEQLRAAYPQASRSFALKRQYDPQEVFHNSFYLKYAEADGRPPSEARSLGARGEVERGARLAAPLKTEREPTRPLDERKR